MFPKFHQTANIFKLTPYCLICKRYEANIIPGKRIADKILSELKTSVDNFVIRYCHTPTLTVVLVGDSPTSNLYVKNKLNAANLVGIKTNVLRLPSSVPESLLVRELINLNCDDSVDGVLLQLPLPNHIDVNVSNLISSEKDVDGFTSSNLGKFCVGLPTLVPCTALAIREIIHHIGVDISGKNAVICGRSKHVGLPIAVLLHSSSRKFGFDANTVICHRYTPSNKITEFCRNADVIISATGVPSLIRGHMVKKGAIVIDVGITKITDPESSKIKLLGDVNFKEVSKIASYITPVPGGVGPITVAMLLRNTIFAAEERKCKKIN